MDRLVLLNHGITDPSIEPCKGFKFVKARTVIPFSPGEEQAFKREMIRIKKLLWPTTTIFEVENEEKEPGFP